jgi:hypothetical protein
VDQLGSPDPAENQQDHEGEDGKQQDMLCAIGAADTIGLAPDATMRQRAIFEPPTTLCAAHGPRTLK